MWNLSPALTELHLGSAQGQSNYWTFTPSETQGLSPSLCTLLHDSPLVLLSPDPPLFCLATQTLFFFSLPHRPILSFFTFLYFSCFFAVRFRLFLSPSCCTRQQVLSNIKVPIYVTCMTLFLKIVSS